MGHAPSVRMVGRIIRDELGMKVTEADLRAWLKPFVASASQRRRSSENSSSQETSTNVAVDESDRRTSVAPPSRLHAHNKVSLSPKLDTSYHGTALPGMDVSSEPSDARLADVVAIETTRAKKKAKPRPSPSSLELRTWHLRDKVLWPLCSQAIGGKFTQTYWRQINSAAIAALAGGVCTDAEIVAAYHRVSARLGPVHMVRHVCDEVTHSDDRRPSRPWESSSGPKAAMLGPVANLR